MFPFSTLSNFYPLPFPLFYGKTRWWTASQPDLHRLRSLLSGDDKKRDQVNELGVVLVYLRLACSLLKIVPVKVGYFWPKLWSFLQIMSLVLKIICFAKWEKQVQKTYHDRVTILFGVTSSSSIVFGILCLKPTVSGSVCWFWYGILLQTIGRCAWLTTFGKVANYGRYCD